MRDARGWRKGRKGLREGGMGGERGKGQAGCAQTWPGSEEEGNSVEVELQFL